MGSNLREFTLALDAFAESIPTSLVKVRRFAHMELLRRLVLRTPVDTGRARGNWQSSDGAPSDGVLAVADKSGARAISEAQRVVAAFEPYGVSYISNNLPYIERLWDGWSKQAPAGWGEAAVDEVQTLIAKAAA